jgi:propanediol dehydratase large subunit
MSDTDDRDDHADDLRESRKRSKRLSALDDEPVTDDGIVEPRPKLGFTAMDGENDPEPSVTVEDGRVVEMDGTTREEFDLVDQFVADHAIDASKAERAVNDTDSEEFARRIVDINVPRDDLVDLATGMTPAKLLDVVRQLNVVEMMMGLQKLRARAEPGIQCHVTSATENPVQIAADAAEAALRDFDEAATTVGVTRAAPLNSLALLVGSQVGRGGVLTQCSAEEATELELGMRGLVSYAESASVYGTEGAFELGDDTPWSKAFLGAAYASRGVKMRYTSGSGSEMTMGRADDQSMAYLEARSVLVARGCGGQGLQNGATSCIAVASAVPGGVRSVLAENLMAALVGLEVAAGNEQTFTHSDVRRTARTLPQLLAGADLIFSGFGAVPNYDNTFAGSNFDATDFDVYETLQRDLKIDGGLTPVDEDSIVEHRHRAARALQAVFDNLGLPPITDEEVDAATYAHGSDDLPERDLAEDVQAIDRALEGGMSGVDVVRALTDAGFGELAERLLELFKARVSGDYLQTAALLDEEFDVKSAITDPNEYHGPGTGYRLSERRWEDLKDVRTAVDPDDA